MLNICVRCGYDNDEAASMCASCRAPLARGGRGRRDDATAPSPPDDTGELHIEPPAATCRRCGASNLSAKQRCPRCGLSLSAPPAPPLPRPSHGRSTPPSTPASTQALSGPPTTAIERADVVRPWWRSEVFVLGTVLATLVLMGVIVFSLGSDDSAPQRAEVVDAADVSDTSSAPAVAEPASPSEAAPEVELSVAEASASSVLEPDGSVTYEPQRTLDGQPETAWNDGVDGDPTGEWLEYTFDAPVRIARIEVRNGYDKTVGDLDLFDANARVHDLTIETDDTSTEAQLSDTREPQSIGGPTGAACRVRVVVDSVYKGSRFSDVAVSEVAFFGTEDSDDTCAD